MVDVEPAADEVRIGRRAGVEIQLPFSTVSSVHARVFKHGDGWALVDMGSSNGTFVGQTKLASGQPRILKSGEIFRLADVTIAFEGEVGAPSGDKPAKTESTATLARRLVNDLFQAVAGAEIARVVVEKGPSTGQSVALSLPDRPYKVGRAPDCDLVLSDDDVSREHAAFERRWQGVFVRDLGSKNGIEIAGQKVRGEQRVHDGEIISLGASQLRVDDPEERYLRQMEADAREAPKKSGPSASNVPAVAASAAPAAAASTPSKEAPAAAAPVGDKPPARKTPAKPENKPDAKPDAKPESKSKPDDSGEDDDKPSDGKGGRSRDAARAVPSFKPTRRPTDSMISDDGLKPSRLLPFIVSTFSLAVLGGVGYLVWVIFF